MSPLSADIQAYARGEIDLTTLMDKAAFSAILDSRVVGTVYTPLWIVERILERLNPRPEDRVLDPAVGRGAFLIPLLERTTRGMDGPSALAWLNTNTASYDVDARALDDLRSILQAWFVRTHNLVVARDSITAIHQADTLQAHIGRFTMVIGNPPYIRFQALHPDARAALQARYASCAQGNVDLYYAFIERALEAADRVGFVVPNSFLITQSGTNLRRLLDGRVESIVDFGAERVFPNIGTYVCLLFTGKAPQQGLIEDHTTGMKRPFSVEPPRTAPVRTVTTGIATLCDKAFAVHREGDRFLATHTGLPVEQALVRPLLKVTKFRGDASAWGQFVLYPYANGVVLAPEALDAYPLARAHLDAVRPLLEARDRGNTARYPQWYAYGRGQGLLPLQGPTALLIPAMMGGASQPLLADISPLQAYGGPLISSGYAVDNPTNEDATAILSERFQDTVRAHGAAKPGSKGALFYTVASWMVKGQT